MQRILGVPFLFALLVLSGCAGTDFVRPTPDAFRLGATTYAQVTKQMGEPARSGEILKNGANVKSISYAYATTGGEPLETGVIPARAQAYYFHNDTLVGQEFISSFKADNTNFDEAKISAVVKGRTTRAQVIQLFGRPSTTSIRPMVKDGAGEALGYAYSTTSGGAFSGFKFYRKALTVTFNDKDLVLDVEYVSSGSK